MRTTKSVGPSFHQAQAAREPARDLIPAARPGRLHPKNE
jgi:hypothetical protein